MEASYDYFFKTWFLTLIQAEHQVLTKWCYWSLWTWFFQSALDHLRLLLQTDIVVADLSFSTLSPEASNCVSSMGTLNVLVIDFTPLCHVLQQLHVLLPAVCFTQHLSKHKFWFAFAIVNDLQREKTNDAAAELSFYIANVNEAVFNLAELDCRWNWKRK